METRFRERVDTGQPFESTSTRDLLGSVLRDTIHLFKKEAELAKAEVKESVRNQVAMLAGLVTAIVLGLVGAGVLAASLVLLLAEALPAWLAAIVVGMVLIGVAALVGKSAKSKGFRKPFEKTRKSLKEDVQWIQERIA
jgi:uncharacterized membrane protein YqjE